MPCCAAGGLPVLLPPHVDVAAIVDRLDGVVLAGGPDVDPARYGAAPDPRTGVPSAERDAAELAVLARALELRRPVLAVCRGLQVLNVGLGGTLVQHVPDAVGHTGHNPRAGRVRAHRHRVRRQVAGGRRTGRLRSSGSATTTRPSTASRTASS